MSYLLKFEFFILNDVIFSIFRHNPNILENSSTRESKIRLLQCLVSVDLISYSRILVN